MPRIRILKNYEPIEEEIEVQTSELRNSIFSRPGNECIFTGNEGTEREICGGTDTESDNDNGQYESAKGWWSNTNIIASFSDAKLKAAISYQKEILALLERESLARKYTGRQNINLDFENFRQIKSHAFKLSNEPKHRVGKIEKWLRRSTSLSMEQVLALNDVWSQIIKEHYNGRR
jgi:hypothetical protein